MKYGSLFTGIAGLDRGLDKAGMECRWQCEIDLYALSILKREYPKVKRYGRIEEVNWAEAERTDVVCGGFPCQGISSSGKKEGLADHRSGLWFQFLTCIRHVRPEYVVVENVSAILVRGIGTVLGSLAEIGYDAEWHCLPAAVFGSPQRRDRCFIIAYPDSRRFKRGEKRHRQGPILERWNYHDGLALAERRARDASSGICRVDDGVPNRVHRLRCLGNAIYPDVAEFIGRAIMLDRKTLTSNRSERT